MIEAELPSQREGSAVRLPRIRTTFQISLLAVTISMAVVFLALVRFAMERQIQRDLEEDAERSAVTFANLEAQRRHLLERAAALIADLPSLKALMTAHDPRTISDGGAEFWRVSGASLFALNDQEGRVVSFYNDGPPLAADQVQKAIEQAIERPGSIQFVAAGGRLIEVLSQPIQFGDREAGIRLGYVTVGYSLDRELAREVGEAASAEIAFLDQGRVVASTMQPQFDDALARVPLQIHQSAGDDVWLEDNHFFARALPLKSAASVGGSPTLLVLKSYAHATQALRTVNAGVALIGLIGLLVGGVAAAAIARTVTRPLESLLAGTRAIGAGKFGYVAEEGGVREVRELGLAFRRMQSEIERTQRELLLAERMATVGRMASSISHDLRHYLTSMYANAEFLSREGRSADARAEMLDEVKTAVMGMTDLLDSLLVFSRTGMAIQARSMDLVDTVRRTVARVKTHPEVRMVPIEIAFRNPVSIVADPQELHRAIYNLLLNACQAAKSGGQVNPCVEVAIASRVDCIQIRIEDNGAGVPLAVREKLFQPFVSEGKRNGTGLGLALSSRIVEAHGGSLWLERSDPGQTVFCIELPPNGVPHDEKEAV